MKNIEEKIRLLIAKAESTEYEAERDAFLAAATRLMVKFGVEEAELRASGKAPGEKIVQESVEFTGNYSADLISTGTWIAASLGDLRTLKSKNHNGMVRFLYVIGHESDVRFARTLIQSLEAQARAALRRWQREQRKGSRWGSLTDQEKFVANRSFLLGYGSRAGVRVQEARRSAQDDSQPSPGAALVLASRQDEVNAWVEEQYPALRTTTQRRRTVDPGAFRVGSLAANSADLIQTRIEG